MKHRLLLTVLTCSLLPLAGACSYLLDFGGECSKDADCAGLGAGLSCTRGWCVGPTSALPGKRSVQSLLSPECTELIQGSAGASELPASSILLGVLLPYSGELGPYGGPMRDGALLAMEEINQVGGFRGRKAAVLSCDTATSTAQAVRAAQHLTGKARVPAIIGPAGSDIVIEVLNEVALPRRTVLVTPSATTPALTNLEDDDLLWRTVPPDTFQGEAIAHLLRHEARARVAVVHRSDAYGTGLRDIFRSKYCAGERCKEENSYKS
ncbi:MAG: hypothetical protein FJ125_14810, partial [Deltaproteobacteria bacterium]|nr:hypothetical protein [Deltaproteobacteria bacterium]